MNDLISVIVPVYNVEDYLDRCIDSIIKQTYKNIEIIIVDDGSTDKSKNICEKYKKKDKRIKLYKTTNKGSSYARNYAIKKSKGKYLAFVDSDDYIENNMIEILYNNLIKEKADISCCTFYEVYKNKIIKKINNENYYVMNNIETIKKSFLDDGLSVYLWNKLYKRELFNGIELPVGKRSQERFVMYEIFDKVKKVVYETKCLYYYTQRKISVSNNLDNVNTDSIEACLNAVNYLKKYRSLRDIVIKDYLNTRLRCYKRLLYANKEDKKIKKDYLREVKNYNNIKYTNKEKLELFLFKYTPSIYKIINKTYYNNKYKNMF